MEMDCTYAKAVGFKDTQRLMFPRRSLKVYYHSPQMLITVLFRKLGKACILNVQAQTLLDNIIIASHLSVSFHRVHLDQNIIRLILSVKWKSL